MRSHIGSESVCKCGEIIMSKKPRSPDELKKASEALYYELLMLNDCAKTDYECSKNKILYSQFTQNILIESFGVHLRNLIEFFEKKHKDYITYQYFLPKNSNIPFPHDLKDKYNVKVNNLLSYLTFKRLTYGLEDKDWRLGQIAIEVNENFKKFMEKSNPNLLCDKLKSFDSYYTPKDSNSVNTTGDAIGTPLRISPTQGPTVIQRYKK